MGGTPGRGRRAMTPVDRGTRPRTCADSDRPPGGDNAMTSSAAAGQRGFRHELLLHRSINELVEFVLPMAREGVAAEEPTLLLVRPETAEAVLQQVGPSPYLTVGPALAQPGRPALHLGAAPQMLASYARVLPQERVIPPLDEPVGGRRCGLCLRRRPRCGARRRGHDCVRAGRGLAARSLADLVGAGAGHAGVGGERSCSVRRPAAPPAGADPGSDEARPRLPPG